MKFRISTIKAERMKVRARRGQPPMRGWNRASRTVIVGKAASQTRMAFRVRQPAILIAGCRGRRTGLGRDFIPNLRDAGTGGAHDEQGLVILGTNAARPGWTSRAAAIANI